MELKIVLKCENPQIIIDSLKVDNANLPKGMQIDNKVNNNILEILIKMNINQPNDILTIRNTADEILTHIKAIQSALEL
ncbi:MAG: KEOPS complex subunit Pcc1 [Saccharolobus sp.]